MAYYSEKNLPMIFYHQANVRGNAACVQYKENSEWKDISWLEMSRRVLSVASFLLKSGIKKGDRIAIFSPNRWEWWASDLAALSIGAVTVPVYPTNSEEETLHVLSDSGAALCFTAEKEHLNKVLSIKKKLRNLKTIVSYDDIASRGIKCFRDAICLNDEKAFEKIKKTAAAVKGSDAATVIYTSGTTGNPKGVLLTHDNFVSNLRNIFYKLDPFFSYDDKFLSFLPLSHVLERTAGYYVPISIGATVIFAESFQKLLENMTEIQPTVIISVPRIYEKIHAGINVSIKNSSPFKKILFRGALAVAAKNLPYVCTNSPRPFLLNIPFCIFDKLVYSKIKKLIGFNNLRFAISGGGPLSVSDAEFFMGMGIVIMEGFGLTETTPVTHIGIPGMIKVGSVGSAIPETEIRLTDEGEILVRGPQVMKGYYKNPKATKEAMTKDGFFKTGDIGRIDEDGYMFITGRSKDIIITSGGKNISPQNIENLLKGSPYIEQLALVGDRRKFISALIVPDFKTLEKWSKKNKINISNKRELCADERIIALFEKEIERLTESCSRVEKVKKFVLLPDEWTQTTGEMTPSQKVKRRVVESKYKTIIDSIYNVE
jgi:long-chain acyl-CoA synthetase